MKRNVALISVLSLLLVAAACFSAMVCRRSYAVSQLVSRRMMSNAFLFCQSLDALEVDAANGIPAENYFPDLESAVNYILEDVEIYEILYPNERLHLKEIASDARRTLQIMRYGVLREDAAGLLKELSEYLKYYIDGNLDYTKSGKILKEKNAAATAEIQKGYYQLQLRVAALH